MKIFIALALIAFQSAAASGVEEKIPLKSGTYTFQHRFAEHPDLKSISVLVIINGREITILNRHATSIFPKGVLVRGKLVWHAKSKQWILATAPSDNNAVDVGGCSDGPEVVDLKKRVYWTC